MAERAYQAEFDTETGVYTKTFSNGEKIEIATKDLPDVSQGHVTGYGMKQIMADCHSGVKELDQIIAISRQKAEDLMAGIIHRRGEGTGGIGINLDLLTQALANAQFAGDLEKATAAIEKFVPDMEADDEETVKAKKSRLRAIRNHGTVRVELDKLMGKDLGDLLG